MFKLLKRISELQWPVIKSFSDRKDVDVMSVAGKKMDGSNSVTLYSDIIRNLKAFKSKARGFKNSSRMIILEKNLVFNLFKDWMGFFLWKNLTVDDNEEWSADIPVTEANQELLIEIKPESRKTVLSNLLLTFVASTFILSMLWFGTSADGDPIKGKIFRYSYSWWPIAPIVAVNIISLLVNLIPFFRKTKKRKQFLQTTQNNPAMLFIGKRHCGQQKGCAGTRTVKVSFEYRNSGKSKDLSERMDQILKEMYLFAQQKKGQIGWMWNWKGPEEYLLGSNYFFDPDTMKIKIWAEDLNDLVPFILTDEMFIFYDLSDFAWNEADEEKCHKAETIFNEKQEKLFKSYGS